MAVSKSGKVWIIIAILLPVIFITLLLVNWFVYPFTSAKPNFADVEAVYAKMVVPADWVKKGEGSNKGIAGRQCPIESDGCFSKVGRYAVPKTVTEDQIKEVYKTLGCVSVVADRTEQIGGGVTYTDFECSAGALRVSGSLTEREVWELTINVSSS